MASRIQFDAPDKRAFAALDDDFTITPDGETATIDGDMKVEITRRAHEQFRLRFKFPGGARENSTCGSRGRSCCSNSALELTSPETQRSRWLSPSRPGMRSPRQRREPLRGALDEYEGYLPLTIRQIFYRLVGAYEYEKTQSQGI
jgi:hypothetical protein